MTNIHNCKESEGKIVAIGIDKLGNTYCSYCRKIVNYHSHSLAGGENDSWETAHYNRPTSFIVK